MPVKPKAVDQYLEIGCGRCAFGGTPQCKVRGWQPELRLLREIILESGLTEEIKWSAPCYTYAGINILMLSALKESAVISFFRGAELQDPEGLLEMPGKNSRFVRYLRFTDTQQISSLQPVILETIKAAIELEKSGKPAEASHETAQAYPEELIQIFETNPHFEEAFHALTPGRQRGYLIYFTSAKQPKTKSARIEKSMPKIFEGKGWNER